MEFGDDFNELNPGKGASRPRHGSTDRSMDHHSIIGYAPDGNNRSRRHSKYLDQSHRNTKKYSCRDALGRGGLGDQSNRSHSSRRRPKLSFQDAIADLNEVIGIALDNYMEFQREFEHETRGIIAYAGSSVLEVLWARKVSHAENHRDSRESHNENQHHNPSASFEGTHHDLLYSFQAAIDAPPIKKPYRISRGNGRSDKASYERLIMKLRAAAKDVDKLASDVSKRCNDAQPLITELEMVITLLEKNRELWPSQTTAQPERYQDSTDRQGPGTSNEEISGDQNSCRYE
ncbi:hypothetical protein MMC06_004169 [Schaereria dolodes]|nr:hypothetical protein [Schaereria dolodes]